MALSYTLGVMPDHVVCRRHRGARDVGDVVRLSNFLDVLPVVCGLSSIEEGVESGYPSDM